MPAAAYRAEALPHTDAELMEQIEAALRWWATRPRETGRAGAPTSAATGGGAIAALEHAFSWRHAGRHALLQHQATLALRAAFDALDVGLGDEVLLPALDWTASRDAVLSLGAIPVPVAAEPDTLTISPDAAAAARTHRTAAAVACHLHGVAADVPAIRNALPGLPIVEDCAAAIGSTLDGNPVGTFGEFAVFSLGPGKTIDADEGSVLLAATEELHLRAVGRTAHPLRQVLTGLDPAASQGGLAIRPGRTAAILGLHQLAQWEALDAVRRHRRAAEVLRDTGAVLGLGDRRENAQSRVPVRVTTGHGGDGAGTSARVLAVPGTALYDEMDDLRRSVRLLPVTTPPTLQRS